MSGKGTLMQRWGGLTLGSLWLANNRLAVAADKPSNVDIFFEVWTILFKAKSWFKTAWRLAVQKFKKRFNFKCAFN
jgi:hypothetical protein